MVLLVNMEPPFCAQVVLIWIMLSMAMSNSLSYKSSAREVLNFGGGTSMGFYFLLLSLLLGLRKKPNPPRLFWVEPRQSTHWNFVERVVWRTTNEMHHNKFKKFYRMDLVHLKIY